MSASDHKIVNQENKDSADIINWREFEALRNEMRREFRAQDDELKGTIDEIKQTLDATNATVTGLADQVTDIQRNIADMLIAIENLTAQQQQQDDDEDPELEDDAHNARGAPRGHRPRGWVPLGRNGRGQDEEDGLGKPKFSIPKFEGGADVEEYLTWELKIEKLWSLHPNYSEDKKIKLASSEFDGYALRWWDSLVRNRDEDGAQPIRTWRAMKEVMTSRFVPTNYMRNIFDKLTQLRQGVKTVDEYYMEMEMLMQRGRVRESLEMTIQRFLNGLKYDIKGIVRHYTYTNMNQLLHHAREAESQLVEEAKVKGRATGAGRFAPRAPSTAPAPSTRSVPYSTPPSKPVSNVSNAKKSESASMSGSGVSTTRNRDMLCHTCGGKGHFKRDCPNRKVMFINEDNEYDTGDDVDPNALDNDDYDTDGIGDVFPEEVPAGLPPLRGITCWRFDGSLWREKTLLMLAGHFYWPKMRRDVDRYTLERSDALKGEMMRTSLPHYYLRHYEDEPAVKLKSNEVRIGPMTRARAKLLKQQVSRGDEHRTRRRRAAGREDGREAGHGAGHEDISWTREGGAGGMRERDEEEIRSRRSTAATPAAHPGPVDHANRRKPSYRTKTGNLRIPDRLIRLRTGRSTPGRPDSRPDQSVCLDQIYSGVTSTSAYLLAVLEPRDRVSSTVVGADTGSTHGGAAATGGATATSLHGECLSTIMVVLRGGIDLSALKTGAGVGKGGDRCLEDLGLQHVLLTKAIDELKGEVVVVNGAADCGKIIRDPLQFAGVGGDGEITLRGAAERLS
ncbi:hypothetical protein QYE76_070246 [Lolium multiflorum]|uniref:CCHC-type domain-containing protein n=1 Tax=Lolium multiflorum TaxID=4521 RepID=A0AAD8WDG4_LOLMU|nr:hypothetical protein QYE76_070246 [Lolium multiflorum]